MASLMNMITQYPETEILLTPYEIKHTEKTVVTAHGCGGNHNLNDSIGIKPYEKFDFVQ